MTQDEIIEMAKEAGFVEYELDDGTTNTFDKRYEAFAKLVAEAATAKEREACAKVCDNNQYVHPYHDLGTLVRARGEA